MKRSAVLNGLITKLENRFSMLMDKQKLLKLALIEHKELNQTTIKAAQNRPAALGGMTASYLVYLLQLKMSFIAQELDPVVMEFAEATGTNNQDQLREDISNILKCMKRKVAMVKIEHELVELEIATSKISTDLFAHRHELAELTHIGGDLYEEMRNVSS